MSDEMDFGDLALGDPDETVKKPRRFSVHDVKPEDSEVAYGKPDNQAMSDMSGMRIGSVEDSQPLHDELARGGSNSNDDEHDAEQGPIYIHDSVENNDEYAEHMEYNEYADADADAHDTGHYRHPSLPPNQQPAIDDDIENATHNKGVGSTIVHDIPEISDYGYEPSPQAYEREDVTTLRDYWCHGSSGIAIEADTDSQPASSNSLSATGAATHYSTASMNEYTRPFMSKLDDNRHWDTVFGNGIISDTHRKYTQGDNGNLIEWVIEVNNCDHRDTQSIVIGLSSDLRGSHDPEQAFTSCAHGYGFDNRGHVLHDAQDVRQESELRFEYRDSVHVILDYASDASRWALYGKVGDLEQADYENLKGACDKGHVHCLFDDIAPGSYRLAVSLFSQHDALTIERCKIHGTDAGEFYQELKAYSESVKVPIQEEEEEEEQEEPDEEEQEEDAAAQEAQAQAQDEQAQAQAQAEELTITVTQNDAEAPSTSLPVADSTATVVFKPMESPRDNIDDLAMDRASSPLLDDAEPESSASVPLNAMQRYKTMEVHSDSAGPEATAPTATSVPTIAEEHDDDDQSATIDALRRQIEALTRANEDKAAVIASYEAKEQKMKAQLSEKEQELATQRDRAEELSRSVAALEKQMASDASEAQQRLQQAEGENERLSRELKLAEQRARDLEVMKGELQEKFENASSSKISLIKATSEELDHYRQIIQRIASNKLGCQLLSDIKKRESLQARHSHLSHSTSHNHSHSHLRNGRNGMGGSGYY